MRKTVEERFWGKVKIGDDDDCWEWLAGGNGKGYGLFHIKQGQFRAHRISYQLYYGNFDQSLEVCHTCDNPGCVNPHHLFIGTHRDNMRDMAEKGRSASKLSDGDVLSIVKMSKTGIVQEKIARRFQISKTTVSEILSGRKWSRLTKINYKRKAATEEEKAEILHLYFDKNMKRRDISRETKISYDAVGYIIRNVQKDSDPNKTESHRGA